ncbi:shieldin complex subunit 2 isoform X2 [Hippocampus comes]|uniref:shieldin complex subunit 2 isoform X2 n=1 Tax=Hippocampus comes TaxID=109280 RepID=UPI00094F29DF|nr:PREDICTED: protein FAM35A isoform X2 [Hippocampus comes]
MCERPKIHVFLAAPRPSTGDGGLQSVRLPCWRRLKLTWREGHLIPAADEDGGTQEDESSPKEASASTSHQITRRSRRPEDQRASPLGEVSHLPADQPEPQLSLFSRYLSTWTLSQALFLRGIQSSRCATKPEHTQTSAAHAPGTPELFSPASGSPRGDDELPGAARRSPEGPGGPVSLARVEQGGVVLEATSNGVLCSQEADHPVSASAFKRARLDEASDGGAPKGFRATTTLLARCADAAARYRVLVAVVHPSQLKEIKVKRGASAGSLVPLASLVVTDQSAVDMTVLLWRRAAFWAAAVDVGDVLFITGLQLSEDTWRGEKILESTFRSKLLNLGHVSAPSCPTGGQHVDAGSVSSLSDFLRERRPLLLSVPRRPPQDMKRLPYAPLWPRAVNTLFHALLRVRHAYVSAGVSPRFVPCVAEWRAEAESCRRSALERHAVASVVGADGQKGVLLLWGSALDWLPRFRKHQDAIWDIRFLLVREAPDFDLPELHTTPWSDARRVDAADRRLGCFVCATGRSVEMDVDTLLSQQYSGEALLRVQALAFRFQPSHGAPRPILDSSVPLSAFLAALSGDVTYSGCSRCAAELDVDINGIYIPCYPCLPSGAVRRYYRPAVLTVSGRGSAQVCVQLPGVTVQKILDVPPDRLLRNAGSDVKHVQVAAERLHALLSLPRKDVLITVRSLFLCDENSAPISRELTLLDLRFVSDT